MTSGLPDCGDSKASHLPSGDRAGLVSMAGDCRTGKSRRSPSADIAQMSSDIVLPM
jgi:hypothetical protein